MTPNESVELLFRCRAEGGADIDRLAGSVRVVSAEVNSASANFGTLERQIALLTTAVNGNTAALNGMEGGFDRAAGGARRAGDAARHAVTDMQAASAAIRGLEGSMNIRAAERFISMIGGIGPVLQAAFPLFGAYAMLSVLGKMAEATVEWANAHDPVIAAQKYSLSLLEQEGKEYDKLADKVRKLKLDEYERTHGRTARLNLEAHQESTSAKEAGEQVVRLKALLDEVNQISHITRHGSSEESFTGNVPLKESGSALSARVNAALESMGLKPKGKTGLEGLAAGETPSVSQARSAQELSVGLDGALEIARMQEGAAAAGASDTHAKAAAEDKKKADEEAKKRKQELHQAEQQAAAYLRQAQTFELTGLERIIAVYHEKLAMLGKTKKAVDDINAAFGIEVQREYEKIQKDNRKAMGGVDGKNEAQLDRERDLQAKIFLKGLRQQINNDDDFVTSGIKVLQSGDDADAYAVRARLGSVLKGNSLAAGAGRISGQDAASGDYMARKAAAEEMFRIETQHLDLIEEEGKRDEARARARKKADEEIYRAAEQYENALQTLREKDLQKYEGMAGSLFDAMRGHNTSQWFKDLGTSQVKQMFTNMATPVMQQAGHALGGLIPGGAMGGLFKGTLLDANNKGVMDAQTTAKQTTRTADEVHALRGDVRAMSGAPAPGAGDGGAGVGYIPGKGSDIWKFGSDIGGGWGTPTGAGGGTGFAPSALFQAGGGSKFGQFFSGLAGMGSNPLGAIFGGTSTNGGTVTELTGAQRAGAAVATGGALLGAGLGIYSGIKRGGAGGYSQAAASAFGAAAMLDPEPISKAILGGLAAVSGAVGLIFGDNKQKRTNEISEVLSKNAYLAPTALNVTQGMDGTFQDFGARGNLRGSNLSAVPTVAEPYITSRDVNGQRQYYNVPGHVTAPYSNAPGSNAAPGMTIVVQGDLKAMDAQSFHDFVRKPANSHSIGEATADHLERHDGRLSNGIRFVAGN